MHSKVHCSTIYNSRTWKQPKHPSTEEWIKKMWYIYTIEYYLAIKKNKIMQFAATWINLEIVILSEASQTHKDKWHTISLTCRIKKKKECKWTYLHNSFIFDSRLHCLKFFSSVCILNESTFFHSLFYIYFLRFGFEQGIGVLQQYLASRQKFKFWKVFVYWSCLPITKHKYKKETVVTMYLQSHGTSRPHGWMEAFHRGSLLPMGHCLLWLLSRHSPNQKAWNLSLVFKNVLPHSDR